jgi:hypothetical protein
VVLDSIGAATEQITETDTGSSGKALAHLLDLARKGPAVLLLGNTIKSAAHYRGSGTWADRLDILYEVRDATDFAPTGKTDWWQELPEAGEGAWAARAARRKQRTSYRLALVPSKFRIGEEPEPFCLEITLTDPWRLGDVTGELGPAADAARQKVAEAKAKVRQIAAEALSTIVIERTQAGQPLNKGDAEDILRGNKLSRKEAREIIEGEAGIRWLQVPAKGSGNPVTLYPLRETAESHGEKTDPPKGAPEKGFPEADSAARSQSQRRKTASANQPPERDSGDDFSAEVVHDRPSCAGCGDPFTALPDGASKTLCRVCQAELRRGIRG